MENSILGQLMWDISTSLTFFCLNKNVRLNYRSKQKAIEQYQSNIIFYKNGENVVTNYYVASYNKV